jgi:lipopolysaccharide/colanic/teichoic acid biosynthesis glycosyltransferase
MYRNPAKEELSYEPGVSDRIHPLGRILRKTKLDELPQIINVLCGEMSFVGPRPEVPKYKSFYYERYRKVLNLRPGITDKASVKYRNEETLLSKTNKPEILYNEVILPDKLKINLEYTERGPSFKEDIRIILETLKHICFK